MKQKKKRLFEETTKINKRYASIAENQSQHFDNILR